MTVIMRSILAACLLLLAPLSAQAEQSSIGELAMENLKGKKILLGGATGKNGSQVLKRLGELGLDVRAMSRDVEDAIEEFGDQYDWVEADVTKPETLTAAVKDVDIVISAVATAMPFGGNRSEKVDYEGTINLSKAAKEAGATRFVIITSSVSGTKDHFLNTIGGNVLIWKGKAEQVLVDSGLEYVVVGPTGVTDDPGGQYAITLMPRSDYVPGMAAGREDMATAIIAAAGHPDAKNRVFSMAVSDQPASEDWLDTFKDMPTELNLPED